MANDKEIKEMTDKLVKEYMATTSAERKNLIADEIIKINDHLIGQCIGKYFPTYSGNKQRCDDLMQAGRIGIFYGLEKYDPSISAFSTFMTTYMRGEMKKVISVEFNETTPHYAPKISAFKRAQESLKERGLDEENITLLVAETGMTHREIVNTKDAYEASNAIRYDDPSFFSERESKERVDKIVEMNFRNRAIEESLKKLPLMHRLIILYAYGFINDKCYKDTTIAHMLQAKGFNVSTAKVKVMKQEAERALQNNPSLIKDCTDDNYVSPKTAGYVENNGFAIAFTSTYEEELRKLDELDAIDCDFDFSREFISSDDYEVNNF